MNCPILDTGTGVPGRAYAVLLSYRQNSWTVLETLMTKDSGMTDQWSRPHCSACLPLLLQLEDKAGTEQMARAPPWDSGGSFSPKRTGHHIHLLS